MGGREGEDHADAGTWHSEVREKQLRNERAEWSRRGKRWGDDGRGSTGYTWREARRGPDKQAVPAIPPLRLPTSCPSRTEEVMLSEPRELPHRGAPHLPQRPPSSYPPRTSLVWTKSIRDVTVGRRMCGVHHCNCIWINCSICIESNLWISIRPI